MKVTWKRCTACVRRHFCGYEASGCHCVLTLGHAGPHRCGVAGHGALRRGRTPPVVTVVDAARLALSLQQTQRRDSHDGERWRKGWNDACRAIAKALREATAPPTDPQ